MKAAHHCYAGATLTADEHHLQDADTCPLAETQGPIPPYHSTLPPFPFFYFLLFFKIIKYIYIFTVLASVFLLFPVGRFSERDMFEKISKFTESKTTVITLDKGIWGRMGYSNSKLVIK